MAHDSSGVLNVPEGFDNWEFSIHPTGHRRSEPTLGVANDGTIFTVGERSSVLRSRDGGASWQVLEDGFARPPTDVDPFLWVDNTTGRLFNARLTLACQYDGVEPVCGGNALPFGPGVLPATSWLAWTDDQGRKWEFNPSVGIPLVDGESFVTGPPPSGVETQGYPNLLYFAYSQVGVGVRVAVSSDGGRTFTRDNLVWPPDACPGGSRVTVAPDGTAFISDHTCEGVAIARSTDGGATWERVADLNGHGAGTGWLLLSSLDVDDAGTPYIVWAGAEDGMWLSHSPDGGDSWSEPVQASHPSITSIVFNNVVAGADGRIAIASVATASSRESWREGGAATSDPSFAGDDAVWHLYVSTILDATADNPIFVTAQVTPDDDPVQRGCVWTRGGDNPCRNLRDYMDMVEHQGSVYVVYPDGCDACATADKSHVEGEATVVIQRTGPLLRDMQPLASPPAPPVVPTGLDEPVEYEFTGRLNVPYCAGLNTDPVWDVVRDESVEEFEFEVPSGTRFVNGTLSWETTGPTPETSDLDLFLFDPAGSKYDAASLDVPETFSFELRGDKQGTWEAQVENCQNPPTDFTLNLELS